MKCKACDKEIPFKDKRPRSYCCKPCRTQFLNSKVEGGAYPGINKGTVGAISELRVAVDLLAKGYEVFRAMSQSCSCDLAILKNGKLSRIEVRTGYYTINGKLIYSKRDTDNGRFDIWAIPTTRGITYDPPLD